jgi:myo-inositol 2-dehydrogenase/D-chiro-inositol 1-dehydrogenase
MQKLRVAVIGAGRIGKIHATNLATRLPDVELVAISDVRLESAQDAAKALRIPKALSDYHDFLNSKDIDAVVICSPTDTHARIIEEAAAAGKHIFCEKPIDLDLGIIHRALAAVAKAKVKFQVGFNRRFDPSFRKAAEAVRSGKLGTPHLVRITSRDPAPPPLDYVKVSGGLFLDMTIHDFDMARYLLGDEIDAVTTMASCLVDPQIGKAGDVDTAIVTLRYRNGAFGAIDNSRRAVYGYDQRVEVFGSKGCVTVSNSTPTNAGIWDAEGQHRDLPLNFFLERYQEAYLEEMRGFVSAVLDGKDTPVTGDDGLQAVLLGLAAKKSLELNRPVKISEVAGHGTKGRVAA